MKQKDTKRDQTKKDPDKSKDLRGGGSNDPIGPGGGSNDPIGPGGSSDDPVSPS